MTDSIKYQVFVSSTFSDLQEERKKILTTLLDMNAIPAGMEFFPAIDEEQFTYIKRVIDESDYYILIIAGKYGSVNDKGISYTELEFDYALNVGKPIIAFIHRNPGNIPSSKTEMDPTMRDRLTAFRDKAKTSRIVKFWENTDELAGIIATSLLHVFKIFPGQGWVRASSINNKELLEENHKLRKQLDEARAARLRTTDESISFQRQVSVHVLNSTRPATVEDYTKWLEGYKRRGGKISSYKTQFSQLSIRIVDKDFTIFPLFGSLGLSYLVMPGVKITYANGNPGHSTVYFMDNFSMEGRSEPSELE